MKFAILGTRGFPSTYGGFETMVRHLAPFLATKGHEVTVYDRRGGDPRVVEGVRVIPTRGIDTNSASTLSHGLTAHWDASRRGFDAALVCNVANGFFLPLLQRANTATVVNVDGIEWERAKWGPTARTAFRMGARLTGRYADTLIADAEAIGVRWGEEFGRQTTYIPYGAEIVNDRRADLLSRVALEPQTYALVVARLVPENNVEAALRACVEHTHKPLVIVGSGADDGDTSRAVLTGAAQNDHVRALGHVADQELLRSLWANARVYIHGHSVGGTNPALLQAMGAGAPTIAFDSVYNREVMGVRDVYWKGSEDLASRLDALWDDEAARDRLGKSLQLEVTDRFSWDDVLRRYERALILTAEGTTNRGG